MTEAQYREKLIDLANWLAPVLVGIRADADYYRARAENDSRTLPTEVLSFGMYLRLSVIESDLEGHIRSMLQRSQTRWR